MAPDAMFLALEEEGWKALSTTGGAAYYRECMTDDGIMVFPGMVLSKDACIAAIEHAAPWSWFRIEEPRTMRLTEDSAIVIYRASAQRDGQPRYTALMSSVYVRRDGAWKLAFHQQTPLGT